MRQTRPRAEAASERTNAKISDHRPSLRSPAVAWFCAASLAGNLAAIDKHARVSGRQARDDEAGVCSVGPGLNAGDDALDPAPARGAVVELHVAAHLARLWGGDEARQRAGFQALDMPTQGRGRRNPEDEVDPVGATPVEDLRATIMAVSAQQDLRRRPVGA